MEYLRYDVSNHQGATYQKHWGENSKNARENPVLNQTVGWDSHQLEGFHTFLPSSARNYTGARQAAPA